MTSAAGEDSQTGSERHWVLVHSMGKVGSYAIFKAIQRQKRFSVLHTHMLNRRIMDAYTTALGRTPGHIQHSREFLDEVEPDAPVKLVVGVREPMGRNVSAFFENLDRFVESGEQVDIGELVRRFTENYPHDVMSRWFDEQVKQPLALDLLSLEWDQTRRARVGRFDVLVVRAEDEDDERQSALRDFLECPELVVGRMNVGNEKSYSETYAAFKEQFRPTQKMLDTLYSAQYVRCFYSEEERETLQRGWR